MTRSIAQVHAANRAYYKTITMKVDNLTREVMAGVAIEAYKTAILATYQDSGQFAYNWYFLVGSEKPGYPYDHMRGTNSRPGEPPVGIRGEGRGTGHRTVFLHNLKFYGFNTAFGGFGSLGYESLIAPNRRYSSITIMNPLSTPKYGKYPDNARLDQVAAEIEMTVSVAIDRIQTLINSRGDK